jgi:hypothetical protein
MIPKRKPSYEIPEGSPPMITAENDEKFTGGLAIRLEGQPHVHVVGSTYTFNNLYPKIYTLSIEGFISDEKDGKKPEKKAYAETLVNVTPEILPMLQ